MGERQQNLLHWLSAVLKREPGHVLPASSDASFRRYWRVSGSASEPTLIVMDAPPDKEDCRPFVDVASRLVAAGINVPRVLAQDLAQGFLLLTDLGTDLYLGTLSAGNVDALYRDAMDALLKLQTQASASMLPPYDRHLLMREMWLFPDWLLTRELQLDLTPIQQQMLERTFQWLADRALEQPIVFVHRDYHSRNLMFLPGASNPGVLDFQDAVLGPVTYDLVSLLKDCYVQWPLKQTETWAGRYYDCARAAGLLPGISASDFLRWFDLMGVQRHLKASGIFARLWHRDGKRGYLGDIPRTLSYITAIAPRYGELADLQALIVDTVLPGLNQGTPAP